MDDEKDGVLPRSRLTLEMPPGAGTPAPKVVPLGRGNLDDLVALSQNLADQIKSGVHGDLRSGVVVLLKANGEPVVMGWGREADDIHGIGLLTLGAQWLSARETKR